MARRPSGPSPDGAAVLLVVHCVERVHHALDPLGDEHHRGVGGPQHGRLCVFPLVRPECAEDVIREFFPGIAPADPDPQPWHVGGAEPADDRLQAIVASRAAAAAEPEVAKKGKADKDGEDKDKAKK